MKLVLTLLSVTIISSSLFALTDQELNAVLDGFEARRDSMLSSQVSSPYPSTNYPEDENVGGYVWNRQGFALSALYLNTQLAEANQAIIDACNAEKNEPAVYDESFHWRGNVYYRIYKYFNSNSDYFPGRLTPAAEAAICDIFWNWAKYKSVLTDADYSQTDTWLYWGSENHDAMRKSSCWSAADILKDVPAYQNLTFDDGGTAAQHYDAWTAYFKKYLTERGKKGLLLELGSHTYPKYTVQGWYNFYDFAGDEDLSILSGKLLDAWWADYALNQFNGVRGGAKMRVYQDVATSGLSDGALGMCWYYLDIGTAKSRHPGVMCLATSAYRLPLVVMDIALDVDGRGTYESYERRQGLRDQSKEDDIEEIGIDAETPGILTYAYHKPEFILGSGMWNKLPMDSWSPVSAQNRWVGAIFSVDVNARIFPQCVGLVNDKTYNQYWNVQNKGTLITQKLTTSTQSGDMRVYFSGGSNMIIYEEDGWIFGRLTNAFAAVRPAWGTYSWDDANWIRFSDPYAPVIMEVAASSDFSNVFSLFKAEVKTHVPTVDANGVLTYTGLLDSGTFTFYTQSTDLPEINGQPVDLAPSKTFNSPFMNEDWDSGIINVTKDDRSLTIDLNYDQEVTCQPVTYDLNDDCLVDSGDLEILAANWLEDISFEPVQQSFVDSSGVLGLWHLEAITPDSTQDFFNDDDSANSGRNNDLGIWAGGAPYVSVINDGKFGNAVDINYSADSVYLLLAGNWDPLDTTFAFRGWIRLGDEGDTGGYLAHVYDRVYLYCNTTTLTFNVTDGVDNVMITAALDDVSQWQYVEAIYTATDITLKTNIETVTDASIGPISVRPDKLGFYIGSRKNANRFVGQMDEIRISTADEIACDDFAVLTGDLNIDCQVDNGDLSVIAQHWLEIVE
ncbi:MAG: hypothetical protein ACIAQZ_05235 [Sedimentisphaeraceae bacterium JB056]